MSINPEIAEIIGVFSGDGWIEKRGTALYITGHPCDDKDYYDFFLAPLFSQYFTKVKPRFFSYWGVYGIASYKKDIINKALSLGFCSGTKSHSVCFPQSIMSTLDKRIITAVLRGLFDADGCFYAHKKYCAYASDWEKTHNCVPRLNISTTSEQLANQIVMLLNKLSIKCTMVKRMPNKNNDRNNSAEFKVWINSIPEIEKWFVVIGSHNLKHITKFVVWKTIRHLPSRTTVNSRLKILTMLL